MFDRVVFSRLFEGLTGGPCTNVGERSTAKNYRPVSFSVVTKVLEKVVNDRIVAHLEKCLFL